MKTDNPKQPALAHLKQAQRVIDSAAKTALRNTAAIVDRSRAVDIAIRNLEGQSKHAR